MARYDQNQKAPRSTSSVVRDAPVTVTATEAKTRFGPLLEGAIQGRTVVITRHNTAKAVLLPMAEYEALAARRAPDLSDLTAEFDAWLDSLQTPESRKGMREAFNAAPRELGRAARAAAQKRRA